jgi:hypothetical protein
MYIINKIIPEFVPDGAPRNNESAANLLGT